MYNVVKNLNKDGVTIVMISHDITTAVRYASHILHLGRRQLFFGKTEDYVKSEAYKYWSSVGGDDDE